MTDKKEGISETKPGDGFREPGLRQAQTTTLFRAVNFELFAKPNKVTMALGLIAFSTCVGYIFYMNLTDDKKNTSYPAVNPDGTLTTRLRRSRWD